MSPDEFKAQLTALHFRYARKCKCNGSPGHVYTDEHKLQLKHMYTKDNFVIMFRNFQVQKQTSINETTADSFAARVAELRSEGLSAAQGVFRPRIAR